MIGGIIQNYTNVIQKKGCNHPVAESVASAPPHLILVGAVMIRKV
jgi:hypothetical protein